MSSQSKRIQLIISAKDQASKELKDIAKRNGVAYPLLHATILPILNSNGSGTLCNAGS